MNNTKAFTKIILAAIGIFFIIKIIPMVIQSVAIAASSHSWESLWLILIGIFITSVAILLLWYFFFCLRDWLAEKIVGSTRTFEQDERISWFPVGLRLACIFAGLYCLRTVLYILPLFVHFLQYYRKENIRMGLSGALQSELIQLPLVIVIGVYLLCGAPHFVRWQVRKTLEQCHKLDNAGSASN